MVASIRRIEPVARGPGIQVPGLLPIGEWIDALVLVANTPQSYTLPTDASARRGPILRITANAGPLYINFQGTAAVPVANLTGTSSIMLRTDLGPMLLVAPNFGSAMSVICPSAAIVTIEAFG